MTDPAEPNIKVGSHVIIVGTVIERAVDSYLVEFDTKEGAIRDWFFGDDLEVYYEGAGI